ncbi:MAG: acyltransferase family protein [Alphaproteobacteria bacterium]
MDKQRINSLDGLRAFAIIFVLFSHSSQKLTTPLSFSIYGIDFQNIIYNGWAGVELFFVLSGFLITTQLLRQPLNYSTVKKYLCKRYFRIAPAYYVAVCMVLITSHILEDLINKPFWDIVSTWWLPLLSHFAFLHDYIGRHPSIDGLFWSIPVEIKFYIIIPAFIYLLTKIKSNAYRMYCVLGFYVLSSIIKISYIYTQYGTDLIPYGDYFFYIKSPFHMALDGLIIGTLCAFAFKTQYIKSMQENTKLSNLIFYTGGAIFLAFAISPHFVNDMASLIERMMIPPLLAISFGLILIGAITNSCASRFLSSGILHFIAKISYCLYLTHIYALFLQIGIIKRLHLYIESPTYCWLLSLPIYFITAVCIAYLLHIYVEKPCLDWSRRKWPHSKKM